MRRWESLAGVGAVVLWIVGAFLLENTDRPEGKNAAAFAQWVADNDTEIVAGAVVFGFGVLLFLWFLGVLRSVLVSAERGPTHLSAIAYGSGIATSVCLMASYLPWAKAAFDKDNISDSSIEALVLMGDSFFGGVELFAIPLLVATALVALRTAVLPRWLAWFSFVLALVLAVFPIGWLGVILGLPLWTLLTSVVLYRLPSTAPSSTPAASS
jgi:hypothetical protein